MQRSVSNDWLKKVESLEHWTSYWYQAKLMEPYLKPEHLVLELGSGSSLVANYWKNRGVKVLRLDVDKQKSPDVVIDGVNFYPKKSFDFFSAFEVFEHLEFAEMGMILDNIKDYVRKGIFISLPIFKKTQLALSIQIGEFKKHVTIPTPKFRITEKNHAWELGYKGYTEAKVIKEFNSRNFDLKRKMKYHRWRYFYFSTTKAFKV